MVVADTTPIRSRLCRAEALFGQVADAAPPLLDDDAALRAEAQRLRSMLEAVAGRSYGRLPHVAYRGRIGARLMGPWSQYLTLGIGLSRIVRMTPWETSRRAIPTILAHELSHRFGFDESITTLRGLEPTLSGKTISDIVVRQPKLRQTVPIDVHNAVGRPVSTMWRLRMF